ncbi:alanine--tRNA ligase-related protein [Deinococcus sp.]|uniref:alanyl-tRNA editing protein n=1 Tax=Deinococcus sp. TaxID=47478 RepID=UPI0025BE02C8|nr:alanine--tRNA ligase-related protein [Deinococcus sp.]
MTRALYHQSQQLYFQSQVVAVQGAEVALAATAFYPASGGQSSDEGRLTWDGGQVSVMGVRKDKATGTVWHRLAGESIPQLGAQVSGEIDPDKRWRHTQRHSAEHLLAQAFARISPAFQVAAVSMTAPECHLDLLGQPAETHIRAAENLLRRTLGRDELTLETPIVPEDQLGHYPLRREAKVSGEVRLVMYRDALGEYFDVSACGGTHVPRAAMCAPVVVLRHERIKQGLTRVTFMAGEEASEYLGQVYQETRALSQQLSVPVGSVGVRVEALLAEREQQNVQLAALHGQLARQLVAAAPAEEVGAFRVRALRLEDVALLLPALQAVAPGEVVIGTAPEGRCGLSQNGLTLDAGRLLRSALALSGGKGGGRTDLAQGTASDPEKFVEALRAELRVVQG